ncbi:MAG: TRAP transporter small permease [Burkholderiaceae bacterium]
MPGVAALLNTLQRIEGAVAALAYATVALLLMGDVLGRELLGEGIFGAPKMAVYAAIVAGFLGLALATGAGSHLRPAFLDGVCPERFDRYVWQIADLISAIVYLGLAWVAIEFVLSTRQSGDRAAVLYWTLWPIQMVMPYAFCSCALRHGLYVVAPSLRPVQEI